MRRRALKVLTIIPRFPYMFLSKSQAPAIFEPTIIGLEDRRVVKYATVRGIVFGAQQSTLAVAHALGTPCARGVLHMQHRKQWVSHISCLERTAYRRMVCGPSPRGAILDKSIAHGACDVECASL